MSNLSELTPGTWTVDPSHSAVGFVALHLMITKVRGRFTDFSGSIGSPPAVAPDRHGEPGVVDTGRRDGTSAPRPLRHRGRRRDVFSGTGVKQKGDHFALVGDLTIAGVTHPVEFDLEFDGVSTDPWGNTKAGFTAGTEISRKEWGLEWNVALETGGVLVGDKVKIELDIQAVRA
jgi:polyisoprenoid-binding protein YceI